jgi:hypothetical protein
MKILQGILFVATSVLTSVHATDLSKETYTELVDENGSISLPLNYRLNWVHLGSWSIADPQAAGHGFHDVYTQPGVAEFYQKTKAFPDGAVIVKEVRTLHQGIKTTGTALWAGKQNIWFVMIKDTKGRFKNNPHWAEGWGWALFENKGDGKLKTNVSKSFDTSCLGCHTPAKSQDWVFTEGYPSLNE